MNNTGVIGYFIKTMYIWFLAILVFANLLVVFELHSLMPIPTYQTYIAPQNSYIGFSDLIKWFQSGFGGVYGGNQSMFTGFANFLRGFSNGLSDMIDNITNLVIGMLGSNLTSAPIGDLFATVAAIFGLLISGFALIYLIVVFLGYVAYFFLLIVYYVALIIGIFIGFMGLIGGYSYTLMPNSPYASMYSQWPMQPLVLNVL